MRSVRALSRRSLAPALLLAAAAIMLGGACARADDLQQADSDFAKRFFASNAGAPKAYAVPPLPR